MKRLFRALIDHHLLVLVAIFVASGCIRGKSVSLRILHVNDLHSNLDSGETPLQGGYAAVKALLLQLSGEAKAAGKESLILNGGDSFEGNPYYFVDDGAASLQALAQMPFDVSVVGNHDFLMGPADFDRLLGQLPPAFRLVGANFKYDALKYPNLSRRLLPYTQIEKAGLKIAVIGLTTNSVFYRWAAGDVQIVNPIVAAAQLIPLVRAQNDVVIVLSHLGTADDVKLVQATVGIDLVVGAHDHVALPQPLLKKNLAGQEIPILQAPPFGEGIGQLDLTLNRDRSHHVDGYRLVPVDSRGPVDGGQVQLARSAADGLNRKYGEAWLDETLGTSTVALENSEAQPTLWGHLTAAAFKDAAGTDIGLDFGVFHGMSQPAGPVTRRTLMKLYPRMFEFGGGAGWTLWTFKLPGAILQKTFETALNSSYHYTIAGATYDVQVVDGKQKLSNLKIGGADVNPLTLYSIALPEGIARGLIEVPKLYRADADGVLGALSSEDSRAAVVLAFVSQEISAFTDTIKDTKIPIWTAIELKVREVREIKPDTAF